MAPSPFEALHGDHREVLEAVGRLESAFGRDLSGEADGGRGALLAAVGEFLDFHARRLTPHMKAEEEAVYPLLDRYLPSEVASSEPMRQEHETAEGLVMLLRRGRERLRSGEAEAAAELETVVGDLSFLLREHVRKEEELILPLLERLLKEGRRG